MFALLLSKLVPDLLNAPGPTAFVREALGTCAIKFAGLGLSLLVPIVLGRTIGAEGYGVFAYVVAWATLLSGVSVLGLDVLAIREIVKAKQANDRELLSGFTVWSWRTVSSTSLVLAGLASVVFWALQERLPFGDLEGLWHATSLIPLLALLRWEEGMLVGFGLAAFSQSLRAMVLQGLFLLSFLVVKTSHRSITPTLALEVYLMVAGLACLIGGVVVFHQVGHRRRGKGPKMLRSEWRRSAARLFLTGVLSTFNDQLGVLALGSFVGGHAAGIFDLAKKGASLVAFPLATVNVPLAPAMASAFAIREVRQMQVLATLVARVALAGGMAIALPLIFFGDFFLGLSGREFTPGTVQLGILCMGQLVNAGAGSVGVILNMTGNERDTLRGMIIGLGVHLLLIFALVPYWAGVGASLSFAISLGAWNIFLVTKVLRKVYIDPTSLGRLCQ